MILPSDDDSRKPGDSDPSGQDPDDALPWEAGADDPPGFFGDDEEEEPGDPSGKVQSPAPPGWREDLKEDLDDAIAELKEIEDPSEDFDPPEPPDLFTFYGELVALRSEMRRASRKTTEALQQVTGFKPPPAAAATGQQLAAALVNLHDHIEAMEKGLLPQLTPLLKLTGLQRVKTKGADFDPATMTTGDPSATTGKVTREIQSGWLLNGVLVRPAKVTIA